MSEQENEGQSAAIAIIGMAGRFPGAADVEELWRVSIQPGDVLRRFTAEELRSEEPDPAAVEEAENYIRVRGILDGVEDFDAEFFGFSPGDAAQLDPQHRLWLEVAWHALESAGYAHDAHGQVVGVYTGTFPSTYLHYCLIRSRAEVEEFVRMRRARSFAQMVNNDPAFLPTRTANRFNLRGPAVNIQTACSTSLVAVAMGVQSLLSYESDIVLAGGTCVAIPQKTGYFYQEGAILSRDGTCRPYDASACGTVFGNGGAAVVLRRLADAREAGDNILAIIRGIAVNNDGSNKVSYVAPSVQGQAEVIVSALELANVSADTIGYVEGHGTATPMGDPIEVEALATAYREATQRKTYCCLGSVKGSVGHLDAAAGVTGLIRAVQALRHRTLPSTAHFAVPNPELRLSDTPFYVLSSPKVWEATSEHPRRAAVSSFGIGGTNVHAVLEEAPAPLASVKEAQADGATLLLSAASASALEAATVELGDWLDARSQQQVRAESLLSDVAFTLAIRRRQFPYRRALCVRDLNDAVQALRDRRRWETGRSCDSGRRIVFAFPGQGSLRPGALSAILREDSEFAGELESLCAAAREHVDLDLYAWFAAPQAQMTELTLGRPALQLAVFCLGAALAAWLGRMGVTPSACVGHSLGEWTAAYVAGVFTRDDAIRAIAARDRLMRATGDGAGLVVSASAGDVDPFLDESTWIACHNSPLHCMVSGRPEPVRRVAERLAVAGIASRLTEIDVAVHTPHMDEAVTAFQAELSSVSMASARLPIVSTVTGTWLTDSASASAAYWAQQIREPVRFDMACRTLLDEQRASLLIELGMGTALKFLFGTVAQEAEDCDAVTVLGQMPGVDAVYSADSLTRAKLALWTCGLSLPKGEDVPGGRVVYGLPPYPFQRRRHWVEPPAPEGRRLARDGLESSRGMAGAAQELATQTTALEAILEALSEQLRLDRSAIQVTAAFSALGLDSLFLVQLAERLSARLGVSLGLRVLMDHNSVQQLAAEIERRIPKAVEAHAQGSTLTAGISFRGLHVEREGDGRLPLFLIHGDTALEKLPAHLDAHHTVVGYMHQGADGEEIELTKVEELTRHCMEEWIMRYGRRPLVIGGHSYGGIIAFQMCHELLKLGVQVPLLVLLDTQHPSVFRPNPISGPRAFLRWKRRVEELGESLHYVRQAKRALRKSRRVPVEQRGNYTLATYDMAIRDYRPPTLSCDTLLFRARANYGSLPDNGWSRGITGKIDIVQVPGDHLSVVRDPEDIAIIGQELASRLAVLRRQVTHE